MARSNLADVDVERPLARAFNLPPAGNPVTRDPDDFAAAFEHRDPAAAVARDFLVDEKVLEFARARHAKRFHAVAGLPGTHAQRHGFRAERRGRGQVAGTAAAFADDALCPFRDDSQTVIRQDRFARNRDSGRERVELCDKTA